VDAYVRSEHEMTWHWNADCSSYPRFLAAIRTMRPPEDSLCAECLEKESQNAGAG
jgi:hypothetical protein